VAFSLHAQESSETDAKTPKLPVNKIIATVSVGLAGTAGLAITPDSNILYDGDVGYSGVIPINVSDPQNPVIGNAIGTGSGGANPDTVAGARSYSWDGANRLVQITYDSGTLNSTTLSYDGFGRLVQIQETENGVAQGAQLFVWIGNTMVEQRNANGGVVKEYFTQGFLDSGSAYYYGKDHLGSIKNLTDSSATIQSQLDYGPYGEVTEVNGQTQPDFGYTGLLYHQRSGLDLAAHRAYDSGTKRWVSRDPIAENGSINLYDYVQNAPMNWTDKAGTDGTPATGGHSSNPIPKKLPPCQQPNNAGGAPTTPGGNGTPVAVPYDPGFVPGVNTPYNGSSPIYDSNGNIIGYNTWNI
jgi:RHS repeat-associated protein